MIQSCDLFCHVVDNYGDAGICWRLAQQLQREHGVALRLWIDDLPTLQALQVGVQNRPLQYVEEIEIRHWTTAINPPEPLPDLVIEAFGCHIPENYVEAMAKRKAAGSHQYWLNLEYLSAEAWTEDRHSLPSIHPRTGLRKYFFFPGFGLGSGGLLREKALFAKRDHFMREERLAWLQNKGISTQAKALLVSLFAYENPALLALLAQWEKSPRPLHCLIPANKVLKLIEQHYAITLQAGEIFECGQLRLQVLPFLQQRDFDRLLWASDINFVRGEDSFLRAHWAGKPFVWQIYVQDDGSHRAKLEAFLGRFTLNSPPALQEALLAFWRQWNNLEADTSAWQQLVSQLESWQAHTRRWSEGLAAQVDLCQQVLDFCEPGRRC